MIGSESKRDVSSSYIEPCAVSRGRKKLSVSATMVDDWPAGQPVERLTTITDVAEHLHMEDRWLSVEEIAACLGIVRESV